MSIIYAGVYVKTKLTLAASTFVLDKMNVVQMDGYVYIYPYDDDVKIDQSLFGVFDFSSIDMEAKINDFIDSFPRLLARIAPSCVSIEVLYGVIKRDE